MAQKRKRGGLKGFTQKSGDMRSTKSGAGMTKKGVAKYRRSRVVMAQTAVTEKNPKKGKKQEDVNHSVLEVQDK